MSNQTSKPTHHLVRYYGSGHKSDSARLGAVWTKEDGSLYIRLYTPSEVIELNGFAIKPEQDDPVAA